MTRIRQPPIRPPGDCKTLWRSTLETGAQSRSPLRDFDINVVGLHCGRHDPQMQMEPHHFCKQVNSEFLQCAIFDGNSEDANLIGIEYIVSEKLFAGCRRRSRPTGTRTTTKCCPGNSPHQGSPPLPSTS